MKMYRDARKKIHVVLTAFCVGLLVLLGINWHIKSQTDMRRAMHNEFILKLERVYYESRKPLLSYIYKLLQQPLGKNKIDPAISMHIDYLKSAGYLHKDIVFDIVQSRSRYDLVAQTTELTPLENSSAELCNKTASYEFEVNYDLFFKSGDTAEIRRTHHTYLNKDSLMIEVGGNRGLDAGNFTKLYGMCHVILEPLEQYVHILQEKFQSNPKVSIYHLGLGAENEKIKLAPEGINCPSTSKFSCLKGSIPVYIINAVDFFTYLGIGVLEVDLLSLDCEGCEFETLETLLQYNIIRKFRNIQWSTHANLKGLSNPFSRYCTIQELLKRTHRLTYQYKFVWESWRRKDLP